MIRTAYIGLGGNLGDRRATLEQALTLLAEADDVEVVRASRFIETEPIGPPQGRYLNAAAVVRTGLAPEELLDLLQRIETQLGRDRSSGERWGARTCDLDIELMDDLVINTDRLTVPHPHMHERDFVLRPLAEIAPDAVHPILKRTVAELLAEVEAAS